MKKVIVLIILAVWTPVLGGAFSSIDWMDDSSLPIDSSIIYTHAVDFTYSGDGTTVINGAVFTQEDGFSGTDATTDLAWDLMGPANRHDGSAATQPGNPTGTYSEILMNDFRYKDYTYAIFTVDGLAENTDYIFTLYLPLWASSGTRSAILDGSDDGFDAGATLSVDVDSDTADTAKIIRYFYHTAGSSSFQMRVQNTSGGDTPHLYAFTNEIAGQVYVDPTPASGTTAGADVLLEWTLYGEVTNPTYNIVIATNEALTTVVDSVSGLDSASFDPDVLFEVTYYWRVEVVENGGGIIYTSPVFNFTTEYPNAFTVDDFTEDIPDSAWTQALLLSRNSGTVSYDTTINDNKLTMTSAHSDAEQIGWLRDDYHLEVGDILTVDLVSITDVVSIAGDCTAGLMIAAGTDIGIGEFVPGGSDTQQDRRDYLTITYDSGGDRLLSEFYNDINGSTVSLSQPLSSVTGFWIERIGLDSFDVGWLDETGQQQLLRSVIFTSGKTPGAAIGFYTNMRQIGSSAVFDNLAINGRSIAIASQPQDATVVLDEDAVFSVTAQDMLGITLSYQWYDSMGPLQNGDYDGRVSGADTPSLVLSTVAEGDQGQFYCELTNPAMVLATDYASLTTVPYLCDENFPSHLDIAGGLNNNGDCVVDLLDLAEFISYWLSEWPLL